jgi:hypothetical protein
MAKDGEALAARVMDAHGLKPLKALRRKAHVKRALAKARAAAKEAKE